ncbi:MAG: ASCH domain-containing protein [Alphaproteobacteria bacterium]|nr:ASCH domain-containing protein [Alphaproteobacteria bacterium]MBN2675507.1 ASCH domain-containing protein [Alphaproteobacteria bacterium]
MKALTLWQPFADAIACGLKKYETRSWSTKLTRPDLFIGDHGIKLAIHSAIKPMSLEYQALADKYGMENLEFGKIVAICDLVDCILITPELIYQQTQTELDFGDWRIGRYAWKLTNVQKLDKPIPAKGQQGLWNINL